MLIFFVILLLLKAFLSDGELRDVGTGRPGQLRHCAEVPPPGLALPCRHQKVY